MRLAVPVSNPVLLRTEIPQVTVVFDSLLGGRFGGDVIVRGLVDRGSTVFKFGSGRSITDAKAFTFGMDSFNEKVDSGELPFGVVIKPEEKSSDITLTGDRWFSQYERAALSPVVRMIAISCGKGEFDRLQFIFDLVHAGMFSKKPHCLYGFYNPAEMSVYKKLFRPFITSRFEMAVCSSCFLYGVYGVPLSSSYGIHVPIPGLETHRVSDLGMGDWIGYDMNRDQLRAYYNNVDVVKSFAQGGVVAEGYAGMVSDRFDLGGSV